MSTKLASTLMFSIAVTVAACGGDDDPFANADPRCAAGCAIEIPELDGAYDVCTTASARTCVELCELRIADVASLCATCLLEDIEFGTNGDDVSGGFCDNGTCTVSGREGDCSYPANDRAARDACMRQVYPRRELACEVEFRPVSECASVCGS